MQRIWWLGIAVVVLTLSDQPAIADVSIVGDYNCVGNNADGSEYKSNVRIAKTGDVYQLQWYFAAAPGSPPNTFGEKSHNGIGLLRNGQLASNWVMEQNGKLVSGIVVYRVQGKQLVGEWAVGNGGRVMKETLTKR